MKDLLPNNMTPIQYLTKEYENISVLEARKYLGKLVLSSRSKDMFLHIYKYVRLNMHIYMHIYIRICI
jgi:hypothetical protein